MISKRQMLVLKAIVEEYVTTNEPVGSKSVCEREEFKDRVSPATIRNDMASLEELGLIEKTHTSSGRVPSEDGYRLYVKNLLSNDIDEKKDYPLFDEIFVRNQSNREQAIKESLNLVSDLTNYMGLVLGSSSYSARIKKLQFIPLNSKYGVILMVTDRGYVESKKIIIPENISSRDIERVVSLLNENLYNCPISEIDNVIKTKLSQNKILASIDYYEDLISVFVRLFTQMAQDKYFLSGQSNILHQPEFHDVNKIKGLMDAVERQDLLKLVQINNDRVTVRIGKENQIQAMQDCTVITVPYETDSGDTGAIAIFGPTRMEYKKIIPLLEYIADNIKKIT